MPRPPAGDEPRDDALKHCRLELLRSTVGEQAVDGAEWTPYLHFDRRVTDKDVEIVGGMRDADGMCRPANFNLFVFVGGRFAGTLSPVPMVSRIDGSAGAVRIVSPDTITAEFARYRDEDPLCCPSSRVTVRYRIERSAARVVVVPVDVRKTRGGDGGPDGRQFEPDSVLAEAAR